LIREAAWGKILGLLLAKIFRKMQSIVTSFVTFDMVLIQCEENFHGWHHYNPKRSPAQANDELRVTN
jgi:hypothetical protein